MISTNTENSAICKHVQTKLMQIRNLSDIIDSEHIALFDANTFALISDRKVTHNELVTYIDKRETIIESLQLEYTLKDELKELYKNDKSLHIY
jgi:hypothetical protein